MSRETRRDDDVGRLAGHAATRDPHLHDVEARRDDGRSSAGGREPSVGRRPQPAETLAATSRPRPSRRLRAFLTTRLRPTMP